MKNKVRTCNFCGCEETPNNVIIENENSSICRSCVETSLYLIHNKKNSIETPIKTSTTEKEIKPTLSPFEYKNILDRFVIGQDNAKKVLSIGIYNHIKRINNPELNLNKSNILMIGNSGTGKTFLVETIAKQLDIPLAIVNTTSLTAAGYIGEDVSSVLERLWKDSSEDVEKAQNGIIFLDEIDKNATSPGGTNNKDVSGKAVQQELLKILEGDKVKIYPEGDSKNRKSGTPIEINTKNILFIAGGAFVGLKDKSGVQINALGKKETKEKISNIRMQEYLDGYGIIPEFYGRFQNITELEPLNIKTMESIMTIPENNIVDQYKKLFSLSDVNINFTKKFIDMVSAEALEVKTGARGLKTIMEDRLNDFMFSVDKYKGCNVTVDYSYNKIKLVNT